MTVTALTVGSEMTDLSVAMNHLEGRNAIETGDMIEDEDEDEDGLHRDGALAQNILISERTDDGEVDLEARLLEATEIGKAVVHHDMREDPDPVQGQDL
jgi:hypothetical protein